MSSSNPLYDNLIIGGGISGLGLAHWCRAKGLHTRVLEREPRVGGCIHSRSFPEAGDYWVEMGSHTCYNSYGHLLGIIDDLQLAPRLKEKAKVSFRILQNGSLVSIFSRLHPLEIAISLPRLFTEKKAGRSVAQYYSRVLGKRNYADLFEPAFNAVICQPAGAFPADKLFRRKPRRKDHPRSFTLPGGLSALTTALADQPGLEVSSDFEVAALAPTDTGFTLSSADGAEIQTRQVSLAIAPDQAAHLLRKAYPDLSQALDRIKMTSIESQTLVLRRTNLSAKPIAGIIAPKDKFFAAVSRDYLDDPVYRGFTFHFQPGELDENQRIARICQVLGIERDAIVATACRRNRLPALRLGHDELIQEIDGMLRDTGLVLTGNYFLGVSIEDCLTRSAAEFERVWGARDTG